MLPLISVIIPTANRPNYLPRALDSALKGMDPDDIEVIIIPNGPDDSWRTSLLPYKNNRSIKTIYIPEANANIARNAGLLEAKGKYVRFLDDDDYLIPDGAKNQYETILNCDADIVSGNIKLVDNSGTTFYVWKQPEANDLCTAVLHPFRNCQPTAHVYRKASILDNRWDPNVKVRQDLEWFFSLCSKKDLEWVKIPDIVGAWQHHWGKRISSSTEFNEIRRNTVPMIINTYKSLKEDRRLNHQRNNAVALALWGCVQSAFFLQPVYWRQVAFLARQIDPNARPIQNFYSYPLIKSLDPLLIQWLMLPKRLLFFHIRQLFNKWKIVHHW